MIEKPKKIPESFYRYNPWPPLKNELKELSWPKLHFLKKELEKYSKLYPDDAHLHMVFYILENIENEIKRRKLNGKKENN